MSCVGLTQEQCLATSNCKLTTGTVKRPAYCRRTRNNGIEFPKPRKTTKKQQKLNDKTLRAVRGLYTTRRITKKQRQLQELNDNFDEEYEKFKSRLNNMTPNEYNDFINDITIIKNKKNKSIKAVRKLLRKN